MTSYTKEDIGQIVELINQKSHLEVRWTSIRNNYYLVKREGNFNRQIIFAKGISNFYHKLDAIEEFLSEMKRVQEVIA